MAYTKTEFPRGISDQAISLSPSDGWVGRTSWSGPQATSAKLQAPRFDHHEKVSRHSNRGAGPR